MSTDTSNETALRRMAPGETEKVVWLIGAGFSHPLGGPLFSELLGNRMEKWVSAWMQWRSCSNGGVWDALRAYEHGHKVGLWGNAEDGLALLDEARSSTLTETLVKQHLGSDKDVARVCTHLSQFVAVATSFFVDRVGEFAELPEAWNPYSSWAEGLTPDDTVISFNYDRAVEELSRRRGEKGPLSIIHLHGTVPESWKLKQAMLDGERISSLSTPGPSKIFDAKNQLAPDWERARVAFKAAARVVVLGYSFPPSDPLARSFILSSIVAPEITIVLGPEQRGNDVAAMFKRHGNGITGVTNTRLYAQQYLAEGRVRREGLRFNHRIFRWPEG